MNLISTTLSKSSLHDVFCTLNEIRIEKLSESSFESFLDVLVEFRGRFLRQVGELVSLHIPKILKREDLSQKYAFESMDASFLKKMPLDSEYLIEYCRLEDDG